MSYSLAVTVLFTLSLISGGSCAATGVILKSDNNTSCAEIIASYYDHCPTWFVPKVEQRRGNVTLSCECGPSTDYYPSVQCDQLKRIYINNYVCMTFDDETKMTYIGTCPYNTHKQDKLRHVVPKILVTNTTAELNDFMCGGLNRTGLLCSQCRNGLGPAVLSYTGECVECLDSRYGWLLYVVLTVLPTTLLCVVIIVVRFDATSPSMNVFIFTCQALSLFINLYPYTVKKYFFKIKIGQPILMAIATFYGFWNLDFFRYLIPPFCISSRMNTLQVIALDYTVAMYPLLLTAVVYYCIEFHDRGNRVLMWLWRPFQRCLICVRKIWDIKGSVVNTFATFLLLSTSKFAAGSSRLLFPVNPLTICNEELNTRVYGDPSVKYFSFDHLPFAILAILILITFTLLPAAFLLLYQTSLFQKCLGCLRLRLTLLHELARVFQRHYKDGTDGTRDYRWFAGVSILLHTGNLVVFINSTLLIPIMALLFVLLQPFKKMVFNKAYSINFIIVAMTQTLVLYSSHISPLPAWPIICIVSLPFLYFVVYCAHKLLIHNRFCRLTQHSIVKSLKECTKRGRKRAEEGENGFQFSRRLLYPSEYYPMQQTQSPLICDSHNNTIM